MDHARHHCDYAKRCLEMARHISDPHAADMLRQAAARHLTNALELEKQAEAQGSSDPPKGQEKHSEEFPDSFYYRAIRTRIGQALRSLPTEAASEPLLKALDALDRTRGGEEIVVKVNETPKD